MWWFLAGFASGVMCLLGTQGLLAAFAFAALKRLASEIGPTLANWVFRAL